MRITTTITLLVLPVVLLCGCKSQKQLKHERQMMTIMAEQNNARISQMLEHSQLDNTQYKAPVDGAEFVGGGLMIEWNAPEDGTCYYLWNGNMVQTKTIDAGDTFEISITPNNPDEINAAKSMFGIKPDEPIIAELWFKPDTKPEQ